MVSIAHLDKFKNKKINTMIKIIIFTLFILCHYTLVAQVSYSIPIQENNESIVEGKFEPTWESLRPVSYTHLDVYKRQILHIQLN